MLGPYVLITVTDTGCGMRPEVLEHIFEPFYTTKERGKGTGLGLAMVYGVVQQHQGFVQVESAPGQGTSFRIHLPVVATAAKVEAKQPPKTAEGGIETILLAEDDPLVRGLALRILRGAGYSIIVACDGEEAIRLFEEHAPTIRLVLLDALMPKLTGRHVYKHIRLLHPKMPVVFCTGNVEDLGSESFLTEEQVRILEKPFSPNELLNAVRTSLDRHSQRQVSALMA